MFSRNVDATVIALHWERTVEIERGHWRFRRTTWKPWGDNVRNVRATHVEESETVFDNTRPQAVRGGMSPDRKHTVMAKHTYFEYEEFECLGHRSLRAEGDSPADVRWPESTFGPDRQRVIERQETYRATFTARTDSGKHGYAAELDETTWRTLKVGLKCRLKVSAFSGEVKRVTSAH